MILDTQGSPILYFFLTKASTVRLADHHIELSLENGAREFIAEKWYDLVYGARPLKRAIQKYIENPLSMDIQEDKIPGGDKISAVVEDDHMGLKSN